MALERMLKMTLHLDLDPLLKLPLLRLDLLLLHLVN
jgi:hypothetical protein|uniref:Uncharacterized protein n=1 Tax=Picea glauca TaxID=3330 RepID=A0A101M5R4_PICGL|nr:hypothetical protein ABT39_MTgene1204 [Picea glauca]QHR86721.1 hypothetical protein Q903MT_gene725 [Picea sitchensis]